MTSPGAFCSRKAASQNVVLEAPRSVRAAQQEVLGSVGYPIKEGLPQRLRLLLAQTLEHHRKAQDVPRLEPGLLAPVRVEEPFVVEAMKRAIRSRKAVSELALMVPKTAPKYSGSSRVLSVSRVTTPKLPPPPPLSAQNKSGLVQALATFTAPSAVTTSASSRPAAARP